MNLPVTIHGYDTCGMSLVCRKVEKFIGAQKRWSFGKMKFAGKRGPNFVSIGPWASGFPRKLIAWGDPFAERCLMRFVTNSIVFPPVHSRNVFFASPKQDFWERNQASGRVEVGFARPPRPSRRPSRATDTNLLGAAALPEDSQRLLKFNFKLPEAGSWKFEV